MNELKALTDAVIKGDITTAAAETNNALDAGIPVQDILDIGLIAAKKLLGIS